MHLFRREGQEAHDPGGGVTDTRSRARICALVGHGDEPAGLGARRACRAGRVHGSREKQDSCSSGRAWLLCGPRGQSCGSHYFWARWPRLWQGGQAEEGLRVVAEALAIVEKNEERWNEAELYRLKGELTLQKLPVHQDVTVARSGTIARSLPYRREAEACFLKAIDIARKQQAKSLELRAVMSLVRLRQHQADTGRRSQPTQHETRLRLDEAHQMLSEIYNWFTEGFDTKDLQEAKVLLEELAKT